MARNETQAASAAPKGNPPAQGPGKTESAANEPGAAPSGPSTGELLYRYHTTVVQRSLDATLPDGSPAWSQELHEAFETILNYYNGIFTTKQD